MPSVFRDGLFHGKVAVVTGGGSGIGFAVAARLGGLGAKVAICGRTESKLAEAREALQAQRVPVISAVCDIREPEQVRAFAARVASDFGPASILVNNAGGQFPSPAASISTKGWDAVIRNNLNGTFYVTQAFAVDQMIPARRGRVVNVLANMLRGFPGMAHTGAARAGVDNLTKTLAVEWATHNVQVNAVAPGIIRTQGIDQYPEALVEAVRQRTPQKRLGTAEEVAEVIVFLASEVSAFVTGQTWYVDGGAHLWGDTWEIPDDAVPVPDLVRDLGKP